MNFSLMHRLAKGAKYCCLTELLRSNEFLSGKRLAERLGVAQSTISYWRNLHSQQLLPYCPHCPPPQSDRRSLAARSPSGGSPAP